MKSYSDSFELFNLSLKSCRDIEKEIAKGQNPYQNLVTASIGERWRFQAGTNGVGVAGNKTIDQVEMEVREEAANDGITLISGNKYGGVDQDPISPNRLITLAGYNLLLGNDVVDDDGFAPPSAQCWNGTGDRISIKTTRAIIDAILDGSIEEADTKVIPMFNLSVPTALNGVDSALLDPRATYDSAEQWQTAAEKLAKLFVDNFVQYTDTPSGQSLVSAGPQL